MTGPEEFDFLKAFSGIDSLAIGNISSVIGMALARIHKGMVDTGISEDHADRLMVGIIKVLMQTLFESFQNAAPPKGEGE